MRSIPATPFKAAACGLTFIASTAWLPALLAPYPVDSDTLHLWHLDEPAVPCVDAAPGGTNLTSLSGGAALNHASFPGFGTALSTRDGGQTGTGGSQRDAALSALPLANGSGDDVLVELADPITGAFTYEAIVRVDFDPLLDMGPGGTGRDSSLQLISGDGDVNGVSGERLFQWRLTPVGVASGGSDTSVPRLEFINILLGVAVQNIVVPIPTNGPHAILSNEWYHAAVVYDGSEGAPGNLLFYWTRLDTNAASANLIGTDSMNDDLVPGVPCDFVVGNEGRDTFGSTDNWIGLIDEVRISSVARSATTFYWPSVPPADDDMDGLPDSWEEFYFMNIAATSGTNDPDGDLFNNLAEYNGGSNPTNALSTPLDTDADTLPDSWESTHLGSLVYGPSDDPDLDGFDNGEELAAGTDPGNPLSTPEDTDADGLPDDWEQLHFGSLDELPSGDFDEDGFTNLEEWEAGSLPDDPNSIPDAVFVRYFPIDDGDTNTSEYGFAGSSAINAVAFIRSALVTVSNRQFIAYYGRHESDPGYEYNNTIWIGRRVLGALQWEIFRTSYTANNINDGHDVVSFAFDGDGYLHMSWGMHGDAFHYSRSTTPVTGSQAIVMGPDTTMTGRENTVTYPQWLTLPDGDLLYLFREGSSGSGDTYLNRYDTAGQTWDNVHRSGNTQLPFLKGRGWSPDYNAYPNMPCLDAAGNLFLVWTWRYNSDSPAGESGYQTNHDLDYARSTDGGLTWQRQDGTPYALPISEGGESGDPDTMAETVVSIPEGYSLINQAGMCLDELGNPVVATWWAPGTGTNNYRRQYMVAFPGTNGSWQTRQVSNRTRDPMGTKYSESAVRDLGRPVIVCDPEGRLIVLYRDNQDGNGLTIVHSLPRSVDPDRQVWITFDLTTDNLGNYEPVIDLARWERDTVLSILHQSSAGYGYSPPANNASPVGVVEWDAGAYFQYVPELTLASLVEGGDATLKFTALPSWGYRLSSSTNFLAWPSLATWSGTNDTVTFQHVGGGTGAQRYWLLEYQEGAVPAE